MPSLRFGLSLRPEVGVCNLGSEVEDLSLGVWVYKAEVGGLVGLSLDFGD